MPVVDDGNNAWDSISWFDFPQNSGRLDFYSSCCRWSMGHVVFGMVWMVPVSIFLANCVVLPWGRGDFRLDWRWWKIGRFIYPSISSTPISHIPSSQIDRCYLRRSQFISRMVPHCDVGDDFHPVLSLSSSHPLQNSLMLLGAGDVDVVTQCIVLLLIVN